MTKEVLVIEDEPSSDKGNKFLYHLETRRKVVRMQFSALHAAREMLALFHVIVLLFNRPPCHLPADQLNECYKNLAHQCARQRKRIVHLVKNYTVTDSGQDWKIGGRLSKMFVFHDLMTTTPASLAVDILNNSDILRFSSPGESFAWQLAGGFLSYILPQFQRCIRSTLQSDDDTRQVLRPEILTNFNLEGLDAKHVLVLPKYFLLVRQQVVLSELTVDMTPSELFPGCQKISKGASDLCLIFDSPGYQKRVPCYLMKLNNPISEVTHAVIFCSYAAPMFVMQKLAISSEDKLVMFQNFKHELHFIMNHPRANRMLHQLSDARDEDFVEAKANTIQIVDVTDQSTLESTLSHEVNKYLSLQSGCPLPESQPEVLPVEDNVSLDDTLPLMSMAFAMAANVWFGFSSLLSNYMQDVERSLQSLPFELPYCFIVPKSGCYPDETKLRQRILEIGAAPEQQAFQTPSGRRYTYWVYSWNSRKIAFEIPTSVLGIRKQAECSVGGVDTGDLSAHLAEFRDELIGLASNSGEKFKVIEWDDVTGFFDEAWAEPTCDLARSLLCSVLTQLPNP